MSEKLSAQNTTTTNQSNNTLTTPKENKPRIRKVIQVQQQHKFVKLVRSDTLGFGFVLRGQVSQKQSGKNIQNTFRASALVPSKQFLESLDEQGPAKLAGLSPGDYLINVNQVDVTNWNHEDLVKLIKAHEVITLHVISVTKQKSVAASSENVVQKENSQNVQNLLVSREGSRDSLKTTSSSSKSKNQNYNHNQNSNFIDHNNSTKTSKQKKDEIKNALVELDKVLEDHAQYYSNETAALNNTIQVSNNLRTTSKTQPFASENSNVTATLRRKNKSSDNNNNSNNNYHHHRESSNLQKQISRVSGSLPPPSESATSLGPKIPKNPPPDSLSLSTSISGSSNHNNSNPVHSPLFLGLTEVCLTFFIIL